MATVTKFTDDTSKSVASQRHNMILAQNTIDFSATERTGANSVSSGDVVQVLNIPKGALVRQAGINVKTAEGSACTATYGDGDTANGWDASVNLNTATEQSSAEADAFHLATKVYAADDTLDLTFSNDCSTAVITAWAIYAIEESVAT